MNRFALWTSFALLYLVGAVATNAVEELVGHSDANHRNLVIGGRNAKKERYPYFASFDHFGGGVLIAPDIILTAGHCNPPIEQPVKVRVHHPRFHSTNFADEPDDDETYSIKKIVRHPNFYMISWDETVNDFNLFKISGFSKQKPVKLNRDRNLPHDGATVTIIGLGSTKPDPKTFTESAATFLQEVDLKIISHNQCELSYDPARPNQSYSGRIFQDSMVCTSGGLHNEKDACAFDSGSPLLLTPENSNQPEDLVVGLVSWGENCADPFFPAVNARVSFAMDWIDKTVCALSDADPSELTDFNCGDIFMSSLVAVASAEERVQPNGSSLNNILSNWAFAAFLLIIGGAFVVHAATGQRRFGLPIAPKESLEEVPLQAADADAAQPSYDTL